MNEELIRKVYWNTVVEGMSITLPTAAGAFPNTGTSKRPLDAVSCPRTR